MRRFDSRSDASWPAAVVANLFVLAPLLWAAALHARSATAYAASVQEDGVLEWATVWAFVLAAGLFAVGAARQRRDRQTLPWFSIGLALFCLLVALEEISWGQRLLGYRPPAYFLEHNFQQELNVHNLIDTSLRKLILKAIIIGYGLALPLLCLAEPSRRLIERLGVWAPPLALSPGFAASAVAYEVYPWKYTGELVEVVLGFGFAFAAISGLGLSDSTYPRSFLPRWTTLVAASLALTALGVVSGTLSARVHLGHPGIVEAAQAETEALRRDLEALTNANGGEPISDCGLHRRVYTWVTRSEVLQLYEGQFAALKLQGLPEERADFFLDPWNSPYWVRHRCSSERQRVFIYSFGPNRRRDSNFRELAGDDVGTILELDR